MQTQLSASCLVIMKPITTKQKSRTAVNWWVGVGGVGAKENNICLQRLCCLYNVSFATSKFVRFFMMTSSNGNIFSVTGHLCGKFAGPGEFPAQRRVSRSFDAFFDLSLNKRLSKQSRGWRFGTQSRPLWRHCNVGFQENSPGDVRLPLLYLEMTLSPVWVEIPQYCYQYKWKSEDIVTFLASMMSNSIL